jgi:hypothetical protein
MTILVNTSTSDHDKHGKVRQQWRQKRKKVCVRIQRVKTDSFFYPTDIHVKDEIIRRYPPLAPTTNKCWCVLFLYLAVGTWRYLDLFLTYFPKFSRGRTSIKRWLSNQTKTHHQPTLYHIS